MGSSPSKKNSEQEIPSSLPQSSSITNNKKSNNSQSNPVSDTSLLKPQSQSEQVQSQSAIPSKSQTSQSQSKPSSNSKLNSHLSLDSKHKANSPKKSPRKQPSIAQSVRQYQQSQQVPSPKNINSINTVSQPLTAQVLSQNKLSSSGQIDIISYIQDVRFCNKSKQLKSFRSLKNKIFSRMTWMLDRDQQYRITLQDLKIIQPQQIPSIKPKITFLISSSGQFISLDPKSKFLKFDGYITQQSQHKLSQKHIQQIAQQIKLLWNMIRKGPPLVEQKQQPDDTFKVYAYKQQLNQKTLMNRYKNNPDYNLVLSDDTNIHKWQINSESEDEEQMVDKFKNIKYPTIVQSIFDYNRYMSLDHPDIPFLAVGNIFHTVMVGSNQTLKCDCFLKKFVIQPKWIKTLKVEQQELRNDILQQSRNEAEMELNNFKKDIDNQLQNLSLKPKMQG